MENGKNRLTFRIISTSLIFGTLFTLISCSQAKQDSGQTQQLPAVQSTQEQAAPVSTAPAQPAQSVTAAQPAQSAPTVQPSTTPSQTTAMLNPPHGQPNHRCDIPVGSPLPSSSTVITRPATSSQVQATTVQPSTSGPRATGSPVAPTVENANRAQPAQTPNTISVASGTKPKLNPAHGQPHHRCDIPVGSPLP